jgi:hypothetical protein
MDAILLLNIKKSGEYKTAAIHPTFECVNRFKPSEKTNRFNDKAKQSGVEGKL